jgi:hypothetical protein
VVGICFRSAGCLGSENSAGEDFCATFCCQRCVQASFSFSIYAALVQLDRPRLPGQAGLSALQGSKLITIWLKFIPFRTAWPSAVVLLIFLGFSDFFFLSIIITPYTSMPSHKRDK